MTSNSSTPANPDANLLQDKLSNLIKDAGSKPHNDDDTDHDGDLNSDMNIEVNDGNVGRRNRRRNNGDSLNDKIGTRNNDS